MEDSGADPALAKAEPVARLGPSGFDPGEGVFENRVTPEGKALGAQLAKLCDGEAERQGRDGRCATCAFRAGDHIANGSPETLMSAFKCIAEREPFWCHEEERPCAGWRLMRFESAVAMPWDHVAGVDSPRKD